MGNEFPVRCSKLPCKKGEKRIPFKPAGAKGIKEPQQLLKNPTCCKKKPSHIKTSMSTGTLKACNEKIFFQFMVFSCQTRSQKVSAVNMAIN